MHALYIHMTPQAHTVHLLQIFALTTSIPYTHARTHMHVHTYTHYVHFTQICIASCTVSVLCFHMCGSVVPLTTPVD